VLTPLDRPRSFLARVRRRVLARRRLLAFLLAAGAVAAGLSAARPAPPQTTSVTVAARDLPAGTVLRGSDLTAVELASDDVPDGAETDPVGETLAAPLRRGEPVTDLRLVGPALTEGHPDLVALPVRFPDAGMAGLLRVGDRVDLLSTDPATGDTETVAWDAQVLALPDGSGEEGDAGDTESAGNGVTGALPGRLVVVGVRSEGVAAVSAAQVRGFLTYAF